MQEEIKEILEDYKQLAGEITEKLDNTAEYESWLIIQEYFDKLLDYITNLQEDLETVSGSHFKIFQENKRLKEENSNLLNTNYWLNSRIDNAIEYINNNSLYEETYDYNVDDEQELQCVSDETATNDLLNILKELIKSE